MNPLRTKLVRQTFLSVGLYRPARILYRQLKRTELARYRQEVNFYSKLLEPGSLCFDVGANVGRKTEPLLEAGMRVVAFEPQPDCVREIEALCSPYHARLSKCQSAVGAEPGETTLYVHNVDSHSSLSQAWDISKAVATIQVPIVTLDQAIAEFGKPNYCKIDVEGWEYEVLKGLTQPIPLLSFEYHVYTKEISQAFTCLDYLSRFGELRINIISGRISSFAFQEWLPLKEFLKVFPDSFRSRNEYNYGDIFVQIC